MKIALISQPFDRVRPPHTGSVGIWTYQVARRLSATHQVTIFAKRARGQTQDENADGLQTRIVQVKRIRGLRRLTNWYRRIRQLPRRDFASGHYELRYILRIAWEIRKGGFDLVHIHNYSQFVPWVRLVNPKPKIVLHMHSEWLTLLDAEVITSRLRHVDCIIGCSEYITRTIKTSLPWFADRCHTVFNGVDVRHFTMVEEAADQSARRNKPLLLFVGRVSPEKGVHILLEAFQKVYTQHPGARLVIVGPPSQLPYAFLVGLSGKGHLSKLARFYRGERYDAVMRQQLPEAIVHQVEFVKSVPHAELIRYYHEADVLINPSLSEAFGMSLIEAMACGVPVVASAIGGMRDIVQDGENGLLVEPGNADALAEALHRLLSDRQLGRKMGQHGRLRAVERFAWDVIIGRLNQLYQETLNS